MKKSTTTKNTTRTQQARSVVYQTKSGALELRGDVTAETVWATQAQMAQVFGVTPQNITLHLKSIYRDKELIKERTCKESLQVRNEGKRQVKRKVIYYNLDVMISVGYRVNSVVGTQFRQWATKTLRQHTTEGFTINPAQIGKNYDAFKAAVDRVRSVVPAAEALGNDAVLDLVELFADTWFSLDAYDKERLAPSKVSKKKVSLTAEELTADLAQLKASLMQADQATEHFAQARTKDSLEGIIGNVLQSFAGTELYPSIEHKAAHLLYFIIKNHPFVDGNKRSGAFAFVWFLEKARVLNPAQLTPTALTGLTLLIAASDPSDKEKTIALVVLLISRRA